MRVVLLNGYQIRDREQLHLQLARVLGLPEYYGGTLDALLDCLSQIGVPTVLQVIGIDVLEQRLGTGYTDSLYRVLRRSGEENPDFQVFWSK